MPQSSSNAGNPGGYNALFEPGLDALIDSELAVELAKDPLWTIPANSPDPLVMDKLDVNLTQYSSIWEREFFQPIISRKGRNIARSIAATMACDVLHMVPDPTMLTHIVTTRCNFSCDFCCYADSLNIKTNELSIEEVDRVYQSIGDNLNVIVYSGGETTLNKNLAEIIESAYRFTPVKSVYIISNAWKPDLIFQITHRVKQRCPDLHLTWSLSIEGPREYNNRVRYTRKPGFDAFQNTIDTLFGLKKMREEFQYTQLDVQLCTVCSPGNATFLPRWYEAVRDVLRPDKWNVNLMRKSVQMESVAFTGLDARRQLELEAEQQAEPIKGQLEPFEETYLHLTEQLRNDVLQGQLQFLYHTDNPQDGALKSAVDLISQEENRRVVTEAKPMFSCRAGSSGAFIGSEGQVSGCEEFAMNPIEKKVYGNLRDFGYDFQKVWRSPAANHYRKRSGKAEECKGCTLESQKNYPSILVAFNTLYKAYQLSKQIKTPSPENVAQ